MLISPLLMVYILSSRGDLSQSSSIPQGSAANATVNAQAGWTQIGSITTDGPGLNPVYFETGGKKLLFLGKRWVDEYSLTKKRVVYRYSAGDTLYSSLDCITSRPLFAYGTARGDISVFNYVSRKKVGHFRVPGEIDSLSFTKNGKYLLFSGSRSGLASALGGRVLKRSLWGALNSSAGTDTAVLPGLPTGAFFCTLPSFSLWGYRRLDRFVRATAASIDGKDFAVSYDKEKQDPGSNYLLTVLDAHTLRDICGVFTKSAASPLCFSHDGKVLYFATHKGEVCWLKVGENHFHLICSVQGIPTGLAVSSSGRLLAVMDSRGRCLILKRQSSK